MGLVCWGRAIINKVAAVTISRQLGSEGFEIAQAVGDRLGYRVVWRELINQAARQCGSPEVALAEIDDLGLLGLRPSAGARAAYQCAIQKVIEDLARQGNAVIIGRAGQVILHGWPGVLHVRITAPRLWRSQRIALQQNVSLEAATAQTTVSDRTRKTYLRSYYNADWDDPDWYDLILNNQSLSVTAATDLICLAMAQIVEVPQP